MFETMTTMQWIVCVLGLLLVISETLPFSSKIKANGIFQAIQNVLKSLSGK